jgi:hypothetical protein
MYAVNILAMKLIPLQKRKVKQATAIQGHPKWLNHVPAIVILERTLI